MKLVILAARKKSALIWHWLDCPEVTAVMCRTDRLIATSLNIRQCNPPVLVAYQYLAVQHVERFRRIGLICIDLPDEFKLALITRVKRDFVVVAARNEHVLRAGDSGALGEVSLKYEA